MNVHLRALLVAQRVYLTASGWKPADPTKVRSRFEVWQDHKYDELYTQPAAVRAQLHRDGYFDTPEDDTSTGLV